MLGDSMKSVVVAFKVGEELAELLYALPNRSAFIREAILRRLSLPCPLCDGSGVVPRALHEQYALLVESFRSRPCEGCGRSIRLPTNLPDGPSALRERIDQFLRGGSYYCGPCFRKAVACPECGWRVARQHLGAHREGHRPGK
jgi:hypothetical protein